MSNKKRFVILFSAVMLALLSSCKYNVFEKKSGNVVFDFTSISGQLPSSSRSALDTVISENETCYIDLKIQGGYEFSQTINLKETQVIQIDNIPVGARITAFVELYTITKNADDGSEIKTIIYEGQSKDYTIIPGENEIRIPLRKYKIDNPAEDPASAEEDPNGENGGGSSGNNTEPIDDSITIYVRYDPNKQTPADDAEEDLGAFLDADNNPNEDPENDGLTEQTGFYYIQSAVNWIAANGNVNKDYIIKLTGIENGFFKQHLYSSPNHTVKATVILGETESESDNLRYKAKSITITSDNKDYPAINAEDSDCFLIRTQVPVYIKNMKIITENRSRIVYTAKSINCNVYLTGYTVFSDNTDPQVMSWSGSSAIYVEGGTVTMKDYSKIENYYSSNGGAVYVNYGHFVMEDNSSIENCKSNGYGGAIYVGQEALYQDFTIKDNATINNCSTTSYGGAITMQGGTGYIEGGNIIKCKSEGEYSRGGAIYLNGNTKNITLYISGGVIKECEAEKGSAIYLTKRDGSVTLVLSDNACIDLSNDIDTYGIPIQIQNKLTTPNEKVAHITFENFSAGSRVMGPADGVDEADISSNYSKFEVSMSGETTQYYINENGAITIQN